ncbi:hypothetical protein ALP83_100631 [Pseudomonas syringae pv. actinidiae]|uniref:Uncharacterized protein n=1 Tax=Pseudomonas syringae pv. actinidiae TaxID=103796 RepID=A0A7Z6UKZ2_PSESF|nr:hypothetical protein ALP83_100631 [Pseudomonas syringae pv. actinidiae]
MHHMKTALLCKDQPDRAIRNQTSRVLNCDDCTEYCFHNAHQNGLLTLANVADADGPHMVESLGGNSLVVWLPGWLGSCLSHPDE